jgi:hypothetical protein
MCCIAAAAGQGPTWLAQQDGVVLGAPAQDLNHPRHLTLTTYHLRGQQSINSRALTAEH